MVHCVSLQQATMSTYSRDQLEDGIEPEIVTARIAELKADKQAAADA